MAKKHRRIFGVLDLEVIYPADTRVLLKNSDEYSPPLPKGCVALMVGNSVIALLKYEGGKIIADLPQTRPGGLGSLSFFFNHFTLWEPGQPTRKTIPIEETRREGMIDGDVAYDVDFG